jgi:hypothetical protein
MSKKQALNNTNLTNQIGWMKIYKIISIVAFIVIALYSTVFYNYLFLYWAQEISLFLPSIFFIIDILKMPGAFLSYFSLFLTQFFYHPILGSSILITMLIGIQQLVIRVFKISENFYPLSFLPSLFLLFSIVNIGHILYTVKLPGYIYVSVLGVLLVLGVLYLYQRLQTFFARLLFLLLFVVIGYPLFGFYALFSVILCVLQDLYATIHFKRYLNIILAICTIITIVLIPQICFYYFYDQLQLSEIYTTQLPRFFYTQEEFYLWVPFIMLFITLIVSAVIIPVRLNIKNKFVPFVILLSSLIFLGVCGAIVSSSLKNKSFRNELKILSLIESENWEKVISYGKNINKPTRLIAMSQHLAMYKKGVAGDRMFYINHQTEIPTLPREKMSLIHLVARPLYFHYGKINYCYRWSMEDMVEYGQSVTLLKYMVKCALMNNEIALARKYNNTLMQTFFHRKWARSYQKFIDYPQLIAESKVFLEIQPLRAISNVLDGDAGLLEVFLANSFALAEGGPPEIVELSLQYNLILKDIQRFWPRFYLYARTHDRIPVHYQEAAVLYSALEGKPDISRIPIDGAVYKQFEQFLSLSSQSAHHSDDLNKKIFKPKYGNTFWYYYFFIKDVKTY